MTLQDRMAFPIRLALVALLGLSVGGCVEESHAICRTRIEPTMLLKQRLLTGTAREQFDYCVAHQPGGLQACRWSFLNENVDMLTCMKAEGYSRVPGDQCTNSDWYERLSCFEPTWQARVLGWFDAKR